MCVCVCVCVYLLVIFAILVLISKTLQARYILLYFFLSFLTSHSRSVYFEQFFSLLDQSDHYLYSVSADPNYFCTIIQ